MTYSSDGQAELAHRVQGGWAPVKDLLYEIRDRSACGPVFRELGDLLIRWDLASDEEPKETLRKGLRTTWSLGKLLLNLGDGLATEANTLI
jgi:hypothetical protein